MNHPRRNAFVLCLVALCVAPSACAHHDLAPSRNRDNNDSKVMPHLRQLFAAHPVWLSIASVENAPGVFPPGELSLVRRWELLDDQEDGLSKLVEVSSSSLSDAIERANREESGPRVAVINDQLFMEDFFARGETLPERAVARFVQLDAKRFELVLDDGRARITFMPAPNDYASADSHNRHPERDLGLWTTPFGPESEVFSYLRRRLEPNAHLPVLEGNFLHHDFKAQRRIAVRIDPNVPVRYHQAIAAALASWNAGFSSPLFSSLEVSDDTLDAGDCLSGFSLCFAWRGPAAISATGTSAYTQLSFDPHGGLILGGLITVVNDGNDPLTPMPAPLAARFARGALGWDELAETVARGAAFDLFEHPLPQALIEATLMHEIGHFNGFAHNFLARSDTTPAHPAHTVMSYPPFPVTHLVTDLGDQDRARLKLVYGGKDRVRGLEYCSTFDAMTPERGATGAFVKRAACDVYTLGDAADWYLRLARKAGETVFAEYPNLSNLPPTMVAVYRKLNQQRKMPPLNILTRLGFILTDKSTGALKPDAAKVHAALCGMTRDRLEIVKQLRFYHGYELTCPAE